MKTAGKVTGNQPSKYVRL